MSPTYYEWADKRPALKPSDTVAADLPPMDDVTVARVREGLRDHVVDPWHGERVAR